MNKPLLLSLAVTAAAAACVATTVAAPSTRPAEGVAEKETDRVAFLGVATRAAMPGEATGAPAGVGLAVEMVQADSPAATAGLREGDVMLELDGQTLVNGPQLATLVQIREVGAEVPLVIERDGERLEMTATLGSVERPMMAPQAGPMRLEFGPGMGELPGMERHRELMERMMREMAEMPQLDQLELRGLPGDAASQRVTLRDDQGTVELTRGDDGATVVVRDAQGEVEYEGPLPVGEDRAALDPAVRERIEAVEALATGGAMPRALPEGDGVQSEI